MIDGLALFVLIAAGLAPLALARELVGASVVVDAFEDVAEWGAFLADGVELLLHQDDGVKGKGLRADFHFVKGGGYAVLHRELDLDLPANYALTFALRGVSPRNHLEVKLIDSTGANVWWCVRRDLEFPREWKTMRVKRREISFAWGPSGGGEIRHLAAIEFAITAGSGGEGSVWFDELTLEPLPLATSLPERPSVVASSSAEGSSAEHAVDRLPETTWQSSSEDPAPRLTVDLGAMHEWGGLLLDWADAAPDSYRVLVSSDGLRWSTRRRVAGSDGGRDYLYLPESESRQVAIEWTAALGSSANPSSATSARSRPAIREIKVQPLDWSKSREVFFEAIARDLPRGMLPRGMSGEQSYWTLIGGDSDASEVLFNEDAGIELKKAGASIEPFLFVEGRLVTWADAEAELSLVDGDLPLPRVRWRWEGIELEVSPVAIDGATSVAYRVSNHRTDAASVRLFLALRPFQVNPPSQWLNTLGGCARVDTLLMSGTELHAAGHSSVRVSRNATQYGAAAFDEGELVSAFLTRGALPSHASVIDPEAMAAGAWQFDLTLAPGSSDAIWIEFGGATTDRTLRGDAAASAARALWRTHLDAVHIDAPPVAFEVLRSLRAQLAWMLVTRAGPSLQPGARAYARSWIRDGALMASALLRLGHEQVVRDYLEWFAPYQYKNGKIPCCVDARGSDPVPEHDSSGEFIYLVAEYHRYTHDRALLERMWPRVASAAAYLDSLRQTRRTDEYRDPAKAEFFGLLPPSISHEGYSAKPMHSYWDDFFAFRGFHDAVYIATQLGRAEDALRFESIAHEFEQDLGRSIVAAMRRHDIDYIPGCADLGDFDATSTAIALAPGSAQALLSADALTQTFERYHRFFTGRRDGDAWEAYTPYETRIVSAYVRLGWRDRIPELLDYFLKDQKPVAWAQFPEVVWREERKAHFLGDLPHTWVGAEYARSVLDMIAYIGDDGALVLGAGVPASWLEGEGLAVRDLRTPYGKLTFSMRQTGGQLRVRIEGGLDLPPTGIVVRPPLTSLRGGGPLRITAPDGRAETSVDGCTVHEMPCEIVFER